MQIVWSQFAGGNFRTADTMRCSLAGMIEECVGQRWPHFVFCISVTCLFASSVLFCVVERLDARFVVLFLVGRDRLEIGCRLCACSLRTRATALSRVSLKRGPFFA